MLEFISEVLAVTIAVIIFIPIGIKKYKINKNKKSICPKCQAVFNCYWFLDSTGYCPNCGESFKHNPDEEIGE